MRASFTSGARSVGAALTAAPLDANTRLVAKNLSDVPPSKPVGAPSGGTGWRMTGFLGQVKTLTRISVKGLGPIFAA
jgi:hypothetical protein